jgi:CRISPR-associated protein Csm2
MPEENQQKTEQDLCKRIQSLQGLKDYPIRKLVEDAEGFGPYLKRKRLETNQIRKFLDAINRVKTTLSQIDIDTNKTQQEANTDEPKKLAEQTKFDYVEADIVLLKPKLAYAAARQSSAQPLSDVMSVAIDKVHSVQDFERLVQFIEAIIAYHKAAGGK